MSEEVEKKGGKEELLNSYYEYILIIILINIVVKIVWNVLSRVRYGLLFWFIL